MIETKALRTFIRICSLFKGELLRVNIKLNIYLVKLYLCLYYC
jgi:hypothetical protein